MCNLCQKSTTVTDHPTCHHPQLTPALTRSLWLAKMHHQRLSDFHASPGSLSESIYQLSSSCWHVFLSSFFTSVKMKVSLLSTLTGGPLASTWIQAADGSDSNGKFILNLSDFNATSVNAGLFDEPPRLRTTSGVTFGHSAPNRPGVAEFLGMCYGKPPVGDLLFAAPQAYTSRDTVSASHSVR